MDIMEMFVSSIISCISWHVGWRKQSCKHLGKLSETILLKRDLQSLMHFPTVKSGMAVPSDWLH